MVELLVAMAIITIGVVAAMGSFKFITQAISASRLKTIATNLAQEKMEVLRNKPYFQLLVTTHSVTSNGYNPDFVYDTGNYAPETISLWGQPALTRAVEVDYASVSGTSVSTVPYTSSDTGMKKISVYVFWTERGVARKVQIDSYFENPSVATLDTSFKGHVYDASGGANISGALVEVIGFPKWRGYSAADGSYSFQVAPGSYTLVCSTPGYFSQSTNMLSVSEGLSTTWDFSLSKIASGTIASDSVFTINPGLVISQVVSASYTYVANGAQQTVEFVELFNPTTSQINITGSGGAPQYVTLNFKGRHSPIDDKSNFVTNYVSTYAAANSYYLIANTSYYLLNGQWLNSDAYYSGNIQVANECGAFQLNGVSGVLDQVGWNAALCDAGQPVYVNGTIIPTAAGIGTGNQIVRFSSACAASNTYGRAYNSSSNANDFYYNSSGLPYSAHALKNGAFTTISGPPATSAYVFADDGNSAGTLSSNSTVSGPQGQSCPISSFTLVGVATGTWKTTVVSGSHTGTVSNVAVTQGATTKVASAATSPAWPASGFNVVSASAAATGGFASGHVYGGGASYSSPLASILVGSDSGVTTRTDSQGFYFLNLATGTVVITANYNQDNGNYTSSNYTASITQGAVTSISDFHLSQGAFLKGYVTSGTGALPNVVVMATNGGPTLQDVTDNTGYFYIFVSTSATAYSVTPDLDTLQSYTSLPANPLTGTVTTAGQTVFVGTITVIGALGTITGSVKDTGASITTGVLVVASTAPISDPPATVYASSAAANAVVYSVSSLADGTYSLDVRSSTQTTYNMRAFYPKVDIKTGSVTYTSKTKSGVSVGAGAMVSGQDFTWP